MMDRIRFSSCFGRNVFLSAFAVFCLADCSTGGKSVKSEEALLRAGDTALAGGDAGAAAALYRQAASVAPNDFTPYDHLGDALYKSRAYSDAFDAYGIALTHNQDSLEIDLKLAKLALILDRPRDAVHYFEVVRRKRGDDPIIWNGLGVAQDLLGDHIGAQKNYQAGLKVAPANLGIRNNYGLSQALAGDYTAAIQTLSAVTADPRATARYRQNLALAYGLSGDNVNASIAARRDISDADSASNQSYYATLRAMDDRTRTRAILGSEFGSGGVGGG
jgi:Flp pilus assembly protein TadD